MDSTVRLGWFFDNMDGIHFDNKLRSRQNLTAMDSHSKHASNNGDHKNNTRWKDLHRSHRHFLFPGRRALSGKACLSGRFERNMIQKPLNGAIGRSMKSNGRNMTPYRSREGGGGGEGCGRGGRGRGGGGSTHQNISRDAPREGKKIGSKKIKFSFLKTGVRNFEILRQ